LTPLSVAVCITAILGGVLLDKFGSKRMLLLGSPLLIAGLFGLTYYVTDSTGLAICLAIIGVGVGFTWSAFQLLMMSFMPKEEEATGVGILNTFKGVGSTVAPVIGASFLVNATSGMDNLSQSFSNLFLFGTVTSIIALLLVIIVIIKDKVAPLASEI
jgi:MFS family permease